jgi:hypothetical protein
MGTIVGGARLYTPCSLVLAMKIGPAQKKPLRRVGRILTEV